MSNQKNVAKQIYPYYPSAEITKIGFPTKDGLKLLYTHEIVFLEGKINYTCIYSIDSKILVSKTLLVISKCLPPTFVRIHKSFIVNINLCNHINFKERQIEVINGQLIPISTRLKKNIQNIIANQTSFD